MKHALIGLYSPRAQSGKTTVATTICHIMDAAKLSFADPMRQALVPIVAPFMEGGEAEVWEWFSDDRKDHKLIPVLGVTLRHMLVKLGTDWGRQMVHPDIWLNIARERMRKLREYSPVVFDDVRFPNEYVMLRQAGAILVRIDRPGAEGGIEGYEGLLNDFPFDATINNDATLDMLTRKAAEVPADYYGERL